MKVIVAGFSKTGTKTLNAALVELGYNVYDFLEHFWYASEEWIACMESGDYSGLREKYKNVDAVCDAPAYYYWQELLELFPDAKVILMLRDEKAWFKSLQTQMDAANSNVIHRLVCLCPTGYALHWFFNYIGISLFGTRPLWPWQKQFTYEGKALMAYRRHNQHVLQNAPKDKLLIYDVKDGWGPLCEFLGVENPNTTFPHKNIRGAALEEAIQNHPVFLRIKKEMAVTFAGLSVLIATGCYFAYPSAVKSITDMFWS